MHNERVKQFTTKYFMKCTSQNTYTNVPTKIFAKRLKMENHIWKRNIKVFVIQVVDKCWYLENQILQEVKMQNCRYSRWMLNTAHCTVGKNCPEIFWMCSKLIHSERTFPRVVRSGPTILKTHFQSILCIGCELLVMFDWYFGDQTIMCYGKPLLEMCWFYVYGHYSNRLSPLPPLCQMGKRGKKCSKPPWQALTSPGIHW